MLTLFSLLAPLLLWAISLFKAKPEWEADLPLSWSKLNHACLCVSTILTLGVCYFAVDPTLTEVLTFSVLTYTLGQTGLTDLYSKHGDRFTLRAALVVVGLANGVNLWRQGNEILLGFTLIFALWFSVLLFFPRVIGASDVRALLLVAVSIPPLVGAPGFAHYAQGLLLLIVVVHLLVSGVRAHRGELSANPLRWWGRGARVLLPMLPVILFPAWLLIGWALAA